MKNILLATLIFFSLLLSAQDHLYAYNLPAYTAISARNLSRHHALSARKLSTRATKLSLPCSIRTYDPICWSESQSGNMMLTTAKHPFDNNPLENLTFYLQHSDSARAIQYTPYYYPVMSESQATFNFFPLPPGNYTLSVSYYFYNGLFRQEGEAFIEFTINPATKMEVPYTKKDIPGMQFFDGEWEMGRSGFIVFNFDSIKNGTPPYEIFYKELCLENSSDTLFIGYPVPIDFTVWDDKGCYMDINDSIIILPDTLHIGILLDKPLLNANIADAHLSIVQYNKPEVLLIDWYKNGVLLKSGLENFLYDVDTGEYYAIGYGQRTGLVSSNRINVRVDTVVVPPDTVVIPPDTIVIPPDTTVIIPPDTVVVLPDTTIIPPDTTIVPPDTIVTPPDTVIVPPDTTIIPPDTTIVPPDTIVIPPDTTIIPPDTTVIPPDTTIVPPDTIVVPPDTTVIPPDTTIVPPDTIVIPPDTIIIPPDTTIVPPDTIVIPPDTIIIPPDTTIVPPDTTVIPPADTLISCDSSIVADFWLCSEFMLYDIGLAVNVSRTPFDSILWTFPPEAELRYEDYEELELQFNDTGTFNIGMFGYYYNCVAKKEVPVTVSMPPQKNPKQKLSSSIIRYATVYPQPITPESVFEIETEKDAFVNIKVYNAATGKNITFSSFSTQAKEKTYLPIGSENFSSGTYILLITATSPNNNISVKTIKIIVL
jgi:hypothetical protein